MRKLLIPLALFAASCTRQSFVPVQASSADSTYLAHNRIDTIFAFDSVFVRDSGDTIREVRSRILYRTVTRRDTVLKLRTDTVPVTIEVEKQPSRLNTVTSAILPIALVALLIIFALKK